VEAPPRRREQRSLFGEILDWMLAPLLLLWPMSLALTWLAAQGIASLPYDRALIESVRSLGQRVEVRGDDILFDLSRETARMLRADEVDNVYYLVRGPRGETVSGDRDLPLPPEGEPRTPGQVKVRDDEIHGDSVRVAYQWIVPGSDARAVLVQVAETQAKRSRLATEIIKGVILPQFVILPVAVLLVWMALVRGLAPLTALQQRIRERASDDVSPIDVREVPEEVSPLVQAINDLLERQQSSLATQKRFLADAAHQLKKPLAGLRTWSTSCCRWRVPMRAPASRPATASIWRPWPPTWCATSCRARSMPASIWATRAPTPSCLTPCSAPARPRCWATPCCCAS